MDFQILSNYMNCGTWFILDLFLNHCPHKKGSNKAKTACFNIEKHKKLICLLLSRNSQKQLSAPAVFLLSKISLYIYIVSRQQFCHAVVRKNNVNFNDGAMLQCVRSNLSYYKL